MFSGNKLSHVLFFSPFSALELQLDAVEMVEVNGQLLRVQKTKIDRVLTKATALERQAVNAKINAGLLVVLSPNELLR